MIYQSLFKYGSELLQYTNIENAAFEAMCLLEQASGINKTKIKMLDNDEANIYVEQVFMSLINRRQKGEPLQYIIGKWEFMGFEFFVGPGVLIPRPETELLVEQAVKEIHQREKSIVFDLCAGTGCIGISIAMLCKNAKVYLLEKSPAAMKYLEKNIADYKLDNIEAISGDIGQSFQVFGMPNPDIIISNPPYIPTAMLSTLQKEVLYEPKQALDGGNDGLDFYNKLIKNWYPSINTGGFMAVECGEEQSGIISNKFSAVSKDISTLIDLNGVERVVVAKK